MDKVVCYVANISARQSKQMDGLKCLIALIVGHVELKWSACRHYDMVVVVGDSAVVDRRGEVVKRTESSRDIGTDANEMDEAYRVSGANKILDADL